MTGNQKCLTAKLVLTFRCTLICFILKYVNNCKIKMWQQIIKQNLYFLSFGHLNSATELQNITKSLKWKNSKMSILRNNFPRKSIEFNTWRKYKYQRLSKATKCTRHYQERKENLQNRPDQKYFYRWKIPKWTAIFAFGFTAFAGFAWFLLSNYYLSPALNSSFAQEKGLSFKFF